MRVVQPGDMSGLAKHIVELLSLSSEQKLALGKRARERVEANYEIGYVANIYGSFYQELLEMKCQGPE